MSIEETYRDWHHHWAVRAAVVAMPTEAMVARLIGIVCLAYTVQMHLGQRVSVDPVGQRRRAQWTVTDRVSWFWCGQRLFADPGYDWTDWLDQQWESLGWPVGTAPAMPVPEPAWQRRPDQRWPLPRGSTPIHPITGWLSLFPSSYARTSMGSPCGSLSLTGDVRGCHVPSQ